MNHIIFKYPHEAISEGVNIPGTIEEALSRHRKDFIGAKIMAIIDKEEGIFHEESYTKLIKKWNDRRPTIPRTSDK